MKMIYQFKEGAHLSGDAQTVGERLDTIRARRGLTPENVVQDARSAKSPLHQYFEWDDLKAAQNYRIGQAGHLIRSVTIIMQEPESGQADLPAVELAMKPVTVRAFMPVHRSDGERVYESTAIALSDTEYRRQVLEQAHSELSAVARKYRELQELAGVVKAIDQVGEIISSERLTEGH